MSGGEAAGGADDVDVVAGCAADVGGAGAEADDDVANSCNMSIWCLPPMATLLVVDSFSLIASML